MHESRREPRALSRITCQVHHRLSREITQSLAEMEMDTVLVESGRTVRELRKKRPLNLPGTIVRIDDAPAELFRITVPTEHEPDVMQAMIAAAELDTPGRGSIFSQQISEYSTCPIHAAPGKAGIRPGRSLLHDLTLITCILSMPGSGEQIARLALELGTGVPVVTLGEGTGVRDRLGLLRITIPPEKELVHLLVPEHDANEIMRLLIEEGRLDRPGRGLVYRTPVSSGLLDTKLRVGYQEHAASIEQIIAAVDELKRGTSWRKRFASADAFGGDPAAHLRLTNRELAIICSEGRAGELVQAAIAAGAGGATTSRIRRLNLESGDSRATTLERSIISVPANLTEAIIDALFTAGAVSDDGIDRIQLLDAPATFSHVGR